MRNDFSDMFVFSLDSDADIGIKQIFFHVVHF